MIHPFLLLENINKDKTGISHPFTIVIISPVPFITLSSPFPIIRVTVDLRGCNARERLLP